MVLVVQRVVFQRIKKSKVFICGPSSLTSSLQGVVDAYILFITLPVTSATNERTFSKLRLIKTYIRSVISQKRLTGLALLSIEK